MVRWLSVVVLTGMTAACSNVKAPARVKLEQIAPDQWIKKQEIQSTPVTWESFNDPDLQRLLRTALQNSPTIQTVLLALESSNIGYIDTKKNQSINYSIASSANTSRSRFSEGFSESFGLNSQMSYELDLWGKRADILKNNELNLLNSQLSLVTARIGLAGEVTNAYYNLRVQDKRIQLQKARLKNIQRELEMLKLRFKFGYVQQLDIDNKTLEISNASTVIIDAQEQRDLAQLRLANLLGVAPAELSIPVDQGFTIPELSLKAGLPAEVLRNRPDIQSAEIALQQSYIGLEQSKDVFLPNIPLVASTGGSSNELLDVLKNSNLTWRIGANLAVTLLDNGARKRNVLRAKIGVDQQLVSYRQSILNALVEVESALTSQAAGLRQVDVRRKELAIQKKVTEQTRVRYKQGAVTAFELTNQELVLNGRQEALLNQNLSNLQNSVALLRALGVVPSI